MFQREKEVVIRADMPGLKKEDVTIEVTADAIVLRGERKQEKEEEKKEGYYRSERTFGSFYKRTVAIGDAPAGEKTTKHAA